MHKSSPEKFAATNNDNNPYLTLPPSQTENHSRLDKVADMFSALSKTEALVIFLAAKNGLRSGLDTPQKLGMSNKKYYARLQHLVKLQVYKEAQGNYVHTIMGDIIYKRHLAGLFDIYSISRELQMADLLKQTSGFEREDISNLIFKLYPKRDENKSENITTVQFLSKYERYFQYHTLANLSQKNMHSIGDLLNSEFIAGTIPVIEKWRLMITKSKEYLQLVISQYPLESISLVASKLRDGVRVSYVLGSNTLIPKGRSYMLRKVGWNDKISQGLVRRRMIDTVPLMMVMTEDQASVSFADINGNPDVTSTFYSNDKNFHAWCNDLWANIWNSSSKFDEDKITGYDYLPI